MSRKFKVGESFRKSDLSQIKTSREVWAVYNNGDTKIYDNVHYPDAFAKKIFMNDSKIDHVIIKNLNENTEFRIDRDGI
jgi:hypothetical protein